MTSDLLQTIARVRRSMPRNADVMALCDALEEHLNSGTKPERGFDKKAWMRDYMKRYRKAVAERRKAAG